MIILSIFFFITALLYSSVGFGGGSTYLALMLIWDIPYYIFPVIALFCNIIVVSGNSINYIRSGNLSLKLLFPYLIGSIPFTFFGATLQISKELFEILLFLILFVAGVMLFIESRILNKSDFKINEFSKVFSIIIGSIIGFFSGIVGIGGGIFLSPILFLLKAGYPKQIACAASLFILINSVFGVFGQFTKDLVIDNFSKFWLLFLAVLIGGQIGNFLNIKFLSNKTLALITSLLVIFVAARMGLRLFS
ncbi:sulfite exporter TauE/SafE family protein [Candidatus Pelagibacter communis]|uniref:sulfite exporter TauE/SafE family protein n=1 Tax=Pelagibacter ubique TaxID=198252 RepID=UPI00094D3583|nr:sulfite exporter TauE/SafE family protein [Candidatus Pelagibacter ubique]|tara:strand:- start:34 stop:780 length:747 start_codon:yes stop_codon:yes gene_type:complete